LPERRDGPAPSAKGEGSMSGIRSIRRAFRAPELGQAVADAVRRGWTARVDGAGHIKLSPPDGSRPERLSTTAYSGPSVTAQLARLRRKGALPERPRRRRLDPLRPRRR
jgi:hypothetical protein